MISRLLSACLFNVRVYCLVVVAIASGCASQTSFKTIDAPTVASYNTAYSGAKTTLVVGNFDNRSDYARGLFSTGIDPLAGQAKTVLKTHLQQTNRFRLVDRDSANEAQVEAKYLAKTQKIKGANFVVAGAVTEFGRKQVGDRLLFGILGAGKQQIAYAKVQLNVINVLTSEVIYSTQGAGEYALSEREVLGFGSKAGYDATLNGKVLDLAVREAVNRLVEGLETERFSITSN
ncbi:CsgG/HfaB family protein [Marinagarivorans algicola]|uniref:CsgG/HfaB family protein n=1 Tax=Marinagarivorans algicola TaxID=1513270 RepID=UPI0006B52BB9|nr:CsgG/HfaB family protein [Marinagarivorans algicola]